MAEIERYPWPDPALYDYLSVGSRARELGDEFALRGPYWVPLFCRVCDLFNMEGAMMRMPCSTPPRRFAKHSIRGKREKQSCTIGAYPEKGTFSMVKLTVRDILNAKGKQKLTRVLVSDYDTAKACEAAGIDSLSVRAANLKQVRVGAPDTFITAASPRGTYNPSDSEAIRTAFALLNDGADAVYMCTSLDRIKAVAKEGIPVEGHVGFVPAHLTWIGGYRAVGKTAEEALQVYRDTLALQDAGAYSVEMEVVPSRVAAEVARRMKISVVSLGSGTECDCVYLFGCDLLGSHSMHYPRHAKKYRNHFEDSIAAFREFKSNVLDGSFPEKRHLVEMNSEEFENFIKKVSE